MENKKHKEERHVVIYGYTREDLQKLMHHFEASLPDYISLSFKTQGECTHVLLKGASHGVELLRFNMNKYQRTLADLFPNELLALEDTTISRILGNTLLDNELTVSSAESCTGGLIAKRITDVPGSASVFKGCVVSYHCEVKAGMLGVSQALLDEKGAVCAEVAQQMAQGARKVLSCDLAVSVTGVAGPDPDERGNLVGLVFTALAAPDGCWVKQLNLTSLAARRDRTRNLAANHALDMARRWLAGLDPA
ncbi:MAG: nicotinamide-nucleotide amidohydrolase family protein, partial [Lachnospiraceae bacterium]|nr:nicotinamide-nucleotide amidohydrolase family protein [Lachnospiraceae bacterium]